MLSKIHASDLIHIVRTMDTVAHKNDFFLQKMSETFSFTCFYFIIVHTNNKKVFLQYFFSVHFVVVFAVCNKMHTYSYINTYVHLIMRNWWCLVTVKYTQQEPMNIKNLKRMQIQFSKLFLPLLRVFFVWLLLFFDSFATDWLKDIQFSLELHFCRISWHSTKRTKEIQTLFYATAKYLQVKSKKSITHICFCLFFLLSKQIWGNWQR